VNDAVDRFELGVALASIYDFTWDLFCDWYIELAKARLFDKDSEGAAVARKVLVYVLDGILRLLHPYMPFITEEIYLSIPHTEESIMIAPYPTWSEALSFPKEEEDFSRVINMIRAIRARRAEMNVAPSKKAKVTLVTKYKDAFASAGAFFSRLASASETELCDEYFDENAVSVVTDSATAYIPLADIIDFEAEKARLTRELEKATGEIERIAKKLSNEGFVAKAPAAVVDAERAKLAKYEETKTSLLAELAKIK